MRRSNNERGRNLFRKSEQIITDETVDEINYIYNREEE
nr:MAG TPA: hypothetical protein [Caudoviricetes sp.]